jgi:hypothetical protein
METVFAVLLLALAVGFWLDSARAREAATQRAHPECRRRGLQFLDETVALRRLRLRTTGGGVRLQRTYSFDFNDGTTARYTGSIRLVGSAVDEFDIGIWEDRRSVAAGVEVAPPTVPPRAKTPGGDIDYGGNVIPLRRRQ